MGQNEANTMISSDLRCSGLWKKIENSGTDFAIQFYHVPVCSNLFQASEQRKYLIEGANSRISYVVGNSETTGISSMHNAQCLMHNEVYDLQGRRMNSSLFTHHSSLKKGLYIKNGRKEVVR